MSKHPKVDPSLIRMVEPCVYEIPIGFVPNMRVPGKFYATPDMAELAFSELQNWIDNPNTGLPSIIQIAYVATLPGISQASIGMPDMHSGYGFSIGGVAAFDTSDPNSIISPGGVGYDINCGVRCLTTNLTLPEIEPVRKQLIDSINRNIPTGVGGKRKKFITKSDIPDILTNGAKWAVDHGYGVPEDLANCEEGGCVSYADASLISERAILRGMDQVGTLGSGNHYVEVQVVDEIFNEEAANVMGLFKGQVVVMIHTGSRGLGYQVADEFIKEMEKNYKDDLPDRQLCSAPLNSELGQRYLHSMGAAANFAWCNRQVIMHFVRDSFKRVMKRDDLEMHLIYDVAHNIAKIEKHVVDGVEKEFVVHRKGATRAFGPGREEIPEKYRAIGQPVLVGGSLGTASYILLGTDADKNKSFGSTCHGAGRTMSRSKALREITSQKIKGELKEKGIEVRAANNKTVIEEAPENYKDIEQVVEACQIVGVSSKVARLVPIGVIKG
ncbi:RtcB family protein [Histomonas meleagridis]|uniref:RtcB family protein n=1 Tax=Histomonas meleagridis TaxID=135588 RepID=UPI0035598742|nr:RtcB family protein [Histomonas meleagridis]KAH0797276.1 RtcB family protein [Histomonas meleagridis]